MNLAANQSDVKSFANAILANDIATKSNTSSCSATPQPTIISLERYVTLLTQSNIEHKVDLGSVLVITAWHRTMGRIHLVNTTGDEHALIN